MRLMIQKSKMMLVDRLFGAAGSADLTAVVTWDRQEMKRLKTQKVDSQSCRNHMARNSTSKAVAVVVEAHSSV